MTGPGLGIVAHRLAGIRFEPSPNHGGVIVPTLGVLHYTAGVSLRAAVDHLCDSAVTVSAHLVIGPKGEIVQLVPFNRMAWHAGESSWQGLEKCNGFTIGVELVNPGYLTTQGLRARHKFGGPERTWALYTDAQYESVIAAAKAISDHYGITQWVGHDDVSPKRKVDPGPAWDWARFRAGLT